MPRLRTSPDLILIDMLLHGPSSTLCPFHQITRSPSHPSDAAEVHKGILVRKVQSRLPAPGPGVITINIAFPAFTHSHSSSASSSWFPPYSCYRHLSHTNYQYTSLLIGLAWPSERRKHPPAHGDIARAIAQHGNICKSVSAVSWLRTSVIFASSVTSLVVFLY